MYHHMEKRHADNNGPPRVTCSHSLAQVLCRNGAADRAIPVGSSEVRSSFELTSQLVEAKTICKARIKYFKLTGEYSSISGRVQYSCARLLDMCLGWREGV